jgi:dTDP-4-dehydrorhamnose 3,5-epimerase-like enzyme
MNVQRIELDSFSQDRGSLIAGEYPKNLPFAPLRFFVVSDVPEGEIRGKHAHRTNEQILLCLSGSLSIRVSDGKNWQEYELTSDSTAIHIPSLHWAELSDFSPGSQLIVLASKIYSASEYINSFEEFLELTS